MLNNNLNSNFVTSRRAFTGGMHVILITAMLLSLFASTTVGVRTVYAATTLSVTPITWDVIGLDSNKVSTGPNHFPIGVRVCNTGASVATNVQATFVWDSTNSLINLRPGTATTLPSSGQINLNAGVCTDFYFEVEVTRNPAAYDTTREYHIEITDNEGDTASSPTPRQLYVEHLVSQFRNYVTDMQLSTNGSTWTSYAANSTMTLVVGQTYYIKLVGLTATQGYEQIESFINFPNTIFQVLSVNTTYTAESSITLNPPYTHLYGDACVWVSNPLSPNYRSCVNQSEKAGGDITVTYEIKILSIPGAPLINPEPLHTLIYDFSGSSYHYNADYSVAPRYAQIVDPSTLTISKNFSPDPIGAGGISALTFTITNPNSGAISDVNFKDYFPTSPAAMTLANTTTNNTCGGTLTDSSDGALNAGDVGIRLVGGTVPANGSCSITVSVTAASVGTYNNTYNAVSNPNHLFVGATDTTKYPEDTLTLTNAPLPPTPPSSCPSPSRLASWDFNSGVDGSGNPLYAYKAADVASAVSSFTGASHAIDTTAASGNPLPAWYGTTSTGWSETNAGTVLNNYFQFTLDTHAYGGVYVTFNASPGGGVSGGGGDWANPNSNIHINVNPGTGFTAYTPVPTVAKNSWGSVSTATMPTYGSSTIYRIATDGASKVPARFYVDNVTFWGCKIPNPPTVTKSFSPNPVAVGGTSTLTINIANPNSTDLTGTVAVTNGSATVTGTGTQFTSELTAGSRVKIGGTFYVVSSIASNTSLTLTTNFTGTTASGLTISTNNLPLTGINIGDFLPADDLTGTISVTNGSAAVVGTGTSFKTQLAVNSIVYIPSTLTNLTGTLSVTQGSQTVTGSGTAFSTELAVGSILSINSVNYTVSAIASNTSLTLARPYQGTTTSGLTGSSYYKGTYTVSSITDDTHLTLTANYGGSTTSGLTMSSGLTLTGAPATTCTAGTVTGVTGGKAISLLSNALTGTVAATNGNATVTGTGTSFTTQLAIGSPVYINGVLYTVSAIASNTSLTLSTTYAGTTASSLTMITDSTNLTGTVAVTNGSATVTGTGTSFSTQLAIGSFVTIAGQPYTVATIASNTSMTLNKVYAGTTASGLTMTTIAGLAGGSSCTITATVKANMAGLRTNITGVISSSEGGTNTTSTGYATANLTAILPPVIAKIFSPNTIPQGGTSTLTFTITNPNLNDAISGIAFTDTYPSGVTNTNPVSTIGTTCTGTLTAVNSGTSVGLSGGSLAAGASCLVKVTVTSSTVTTDLSGTLSVTNGSTTVATSANLTSELAIGDVIYILGTGYKLAAVSSTNLTLATPYAGATASGLTVPKGFFNNYSATIPGHSTTSNNGIVSHVVNSTTYYGNTPSDTLMVETAVPAIELGKEVGLTSNIDGDWFDSMIVASGTNVYYKFTVANIGKVNFASINVTDPSLAGTFGSPLSCTWYKLDPADTTPPYSYVTTTTLPWAASPTADPTAYCIIGPVAAIAGRVVNTATAHGTTGGGVTVDSPPDSAAYQNGNFGHLPYSTYDYMNIYNEGGAFHITGSTYLGAQAPVETDGSNNNTYVPDTAYDDGVTWTPGVLWKQGTAAGSNGGSVNVTVACPAPNCYLHAWFDWNGDGDFDDPGEHVIGQPVGNGAITLTFDIPVTGAAGDLLNGTFYSRFRLYSTDPGLSVTPNGQTIVGTGEVEDYKFVANNGVVTPVTVSYFRAQRQGGNVNFEWSTSTETGNAGFNLYVEDGGQLKQINDQLIPSQVFDSLTNQDYTYSAEVKGNTFYIEDVSLSGEIRKHGPFQLGQTYGDELSAEKVNWTAVQSQNGNAQNIRQKEMKSELVLSPSIQAKLKKGDVSGLSQQLALTSLNFKVSQTGIYRVTYEAIKNAGLDLAGVPNSKITLTNRGAAVPVYVEGNGKFGPGGFVEFYGEALDTLYTDTNIYTLQVSNSPAAQINGNNAVAGVGLQTVSFYAETLKVNKQRVYASSAPGGDDPWYDTSMMTFTSPKSWNFPFQVDGLTNSSSPASLELVVWGMTDWPQSADHHLQVVVNNVPVADEIFGGSAVRTLNVNLPAGALKNGENILQLTLAGDTGVAYDVTYLDKFSITYQREFKAQDGRLTFTSAGKAFQVTNLPSKDVVVYRMSEDGSVVRLNQVKVQKTGSTFTATFAGTNQVQKYVVAATETLSVPEIEIVRLKEDLIHPAQYLIISHPDFIDGIQPLAQARRAQGMTVSVVDVMDLYAQYTYGIIDPQAIKEYISYASQNLGTQYVLLVGGDTYDYRNYLGINSLSFIPSLYANTGQYTRFAPVDPLYADVNSDNVPDLAIGRFPARTTTELALIVAKTLSYANKDYNRTAVFLSDQADGVVSFKEINTTLTAKLPSDWSVENIHLDNTSLTTARQNLIAAMNKGTAMVTFTGHSDLYRWNFSNLFTYKNAATLTNNGRPFVAVQWGCYNTYYVDPVNNSLVQSFLFSGDQGAAALLGASTRTNSESEHALGVLLTPRLSKSGEPIGKALLEAKHELAQANPGLVDVLLGWTLMGDPTLIVEP